MLLEQKRHRNNVNVTPLSAVKLTCFKDRPQLHSTARSSAHQQKIIMYFLKKVFTINFITRILITETLRQLLW
jgi:hypothetical protein